MKRILYCGYMKSPFARTDAEMLEAMSNTVRRVNLSEIASRFGQLPLYMVRYFTQILPGTIRSDIVWIWTADYFILPIFVTGKILRKRVVVHINGYELHNDSDIGYGLQLKPIRGAISRWIMRHADTNIVQSQAYVIRAVKLIPEIRLALLPAAIHVPEMSSKKYEIVMTAYCSYRDSDKIKGIDTFRRALYNLPYRSIIMKDQSHNHLMGQLQTVKVYCQLSYTEQFGQVVLEAMASGCVPVVTDRGGLPELVGNAGLIVPFGDAEATAVAIQEAMEMDSDMAAERSRDQARNFHLARKFANLSTIVEPELWKRNH